MKKGLVSILIPNYNYGKYLENCLESVLSQTYKNIEVIFKDNNSTDNSFDIAYRYREKFQKKGVFCSISQNKYNLGSAINSQKCYNECEGDYLIYLSSDDMIKPDFIEKCVDILDKHLNVGMVITHRDEIDENDRITSIPPFYNQNCIVPGEEQAAVFMMAGIGVPSQCMIRKSDYIKSRKEAGLAFSIAGDWYNNFLMAMYADIAYIKEPLCLYRVHSGNETSESEENLLGIFEHYQLINTFVKIAERHGMKKPIERYDLAVEKLGSMCLRYALKMLKNGLNDAAYRYLNLAPVLKRNIVEEENYKRLLECVNLTGDTLNERIKVFDKENDMARRVSYDPPEGFIVVKT